MTITLSISEAQAKRDAAFAAHQAILDAIAHHEAAIKDNAPHAAVAGGKNLADAAKAQNEARQHLDFCQEAKGAAWAVFQVSDAALRFAHAHAAHADKLNAAIEARIAAAEKAADARAALADAERTMREAAAVIRAAASAGLVLPGDAHVDRFELTPMSDPLPRFRFRSPADEAGMWGRA